LGAALERFGNELADLNCPNMVNIISSHTADISWFVGPYHEWGRTNQKCNVFVSQNATSQEVAACAYT
jgi:hypothetical protein